MFAYGMEKKGWLYNSFWTNSTVRLPFEEQDGNVQGMYMPAVSIVARFNAKEEGMDILREFWLVCYTMCVSASVTNNTQVKNTLLALWGIIIPGLAFLTLVVLLIGVHLTKAGRTFQALRAQARRSTATSYKLTGEEVLLLAVGYGRVTVCLQMHGVP